MPAETRPFIALVLGFNDKFSMKEGRVIGKTAEDLQGPVGKKGSVHRGLLSFQAKNKHASAGGTHELSSLSRSNRRSTGSDCDRLV